MMDSEEHTQEQHDLDSRENWILAYFLEELNRILNSIYILVFVQILVECAYRCKKNDLWVRLVKFARSDSNAKKTYGSNVIKKWCPGVSLTTSTANVVDRHVDIFRRSSFAE
jgi:hypothetical protein